MKKLFGNRGRPTFAMQMLLLAVVGTVSWVRLSQDAGGTASATGSLVQQSPAENSISGASHKANELLHAGSAALFQVEAVSDVLFPHPGRPDGYAFTAGVMAVFKWETPYLREWIMYHLLIGVQRLWLVSNDCDDRSASALAVLAPFIAEGSVALVRAFECDTQIQLPAYNAVLETVRRRRSVQWLVIIDVDEFVVLEHQNTTLLDVLAGFDPEVAGVGIHRLIFGHTGHYDPPPHQSVLATYTHHAHPFLHMGWFFRFVKMIVRPQHCLQVTDHGCVLPAPVSTVNGEPARNRSTVDTVGDPQEYHRSSSEIRAPTYSVLQGLWLNHYYTKSVSEFLRKDERGDAKFGDRPAKALPSRLDDMASFAVVDWVQHRLTALEATRPQVVDEYAAVLLAGAPDAAARNATQAQSKMPDLFWSSQFLREGTEKQRAHKWPLNPRVFKHIYGHTSQPLAPRVPYAPPVSTPPLTAPQVRELIDVLHTAPERGTSSTEGRTPLPVYSGSRVGLVAVLNGDQLYLHEWIEYHLLLGVQHFWLVLKQCNTDKKDAQSSSLGAFMSAGVLTVSNTLACRKLDPNRITSFHASAFGLVHAEVRGGFFEAPQQQVDWLGIIETNEFLVLEDPGQSVGSFVEQFHDPPIAAVALNRLLFGPSGFMEPPKGSQLASYSYHSNPYTRTGANVWSTKMMVRVGTDAPLCKSFHVHGCSQLANVSQLAVVNPNKEPHTYFLDESTPAPPPAPCFHGGWLATYHTRSLGEYLEKSMRTPYFGPEEWHGLPRGIDDVLTTHVAAAACARVEALQRGYPSSLVVQVWATRLRALLLVSGQDVPDDIKRTPPANPALWSTHFIEQGEWQLKQADLQRQGV